MKRANKFAQLVADAKRHAIGGDITKEGMAGLIRRAASWGIQESEAKETIERTGPSPKVSRAGVTYHGAD